MSDVQTKTEESTPVVTDLVDGQLSLMEPAILRSRPWSLAILFLLTCTIAGTGLWFTSDYLLRELRRLEPWKGILIWTGDAVILFWFAHFFVRHFVVGVPLRSQPLGEFKSREWVWAVGMVLVGMAADIGITLFLIAEEDREFAGANVVMGQAVATRTRAFTRDVYHDVACEYQDNNGRQHEERYVICEDTFKGFPPAVPKELVEGIRKQQGPFPIRISYEPSWPARSWLTDFGPVAGNRLHYFSLCLPFAQLLALCLYGVILAIVVSHTKMVPWWFELHKVVPFLMGAVILAACGVGLYLSGDWHIVWM